jgi:chaperonin GroES
MKPIRDFVLIKPYPAEEKSEGGLFLPEQYRERSSKAHVVGVGRGTAEIKMEAKSGDTIFHIKNAGTEVLINGEQHFLIRQMDILSYVSNN